MRPRSPKLRALNQAELHLEISETGRIRTDTQHLLRMLALPVSTLSRKWLDQDFHLEYIRLNAGRFKC